MRQRHRQGKLNRRKKQKRKKLARIEKWNVEFKYQHSGQGLSRIYGGFNRQVAFRGIRLRNDDSHASGMTFEIFVLDSHIAHPD